MFLSKKLIEMLYARAESGPGASGIGMDVDTFCSKCVAFLIVVVPNKYK